MKVNVKKTILMRYNIIVQKILIEQVAKLTFMDLNIDAVGSIES